MRLRVQFVEIWPFKIFITYFLSSSTGVQLAINSAILIETAMSLGFIHCTISLNQFGPFLPMRSCFMESISVIKNPKTSLSGHGPYVYELRFTTVAAVKRGRLARRPLQKRTRHVLCRAFILHPTIFFMYSRRRLLPSF